MESATSREVRRLTRSWRRGPPVHVVASPEDFPGGADDLTHAMFVGGEVFIRDNPPSDVASLVAHEAVVHFGLRQLLGPRGWADWMAAVLAGARDGDPKLSSAQRHVHRVYGEDLRPRISADETLARLVESRTDSRTGRLRIEKPLVKRWAALRGRVARDLLHCRWPATLDEAEGTLLEAECLIRAGWVSTVPPWRWYRAPMPTKPMGASRPPRSVAESEAWIKAERERWDWWYGLQAFGLVLLIVIGVPLWLWAMFSGLVNFLRMIFGH